MYSSHNVDAVLVENMHDIPYVQDQRLGPEVVSCMTILVSEVLRAVKPTVKCGIQILACGNKQALAVAKATGAHFIRNEGFVFSHVADEGFTDANAGETMRYRRNIDAGEVLVFTDIKKKHSSHSITADTSLLETAKAAEFFLSDGVILTGTGTGHAADVADLEEVHGKVQVPILIGSGVTEANLENYLKAKGLIIGSHFKVSGRWEEAICEKRLQSFMEKVQKLRICEAKN